MAASSELVVALDDMVELLPCGSRVHDDDHWQSPRERGNARARSALPRSPISKPQITVSYNLVRKKRRPAEIRAPAPYQFAAAPDRSPAATAMQPHLATITHVTPSSR